MLSFTAKTTEPVRLAQAVDKHVNRTYDASTARALLPYLERFEAARGRIIGSEQNKAKLVYLAEYSGTWKN
jgi:hypothetical protein